MLYCNHCYASVQVGADNAPTSTTCKFCNQTIKNPVELIEYAGLVAQQKHKKIVKLKNVLGLIYVSALVLPLIIHTLLIFSQRPYEFYDFSLHQRYSNSRRGISWFTSDNYLYCGLSFFTIALPFFIIVEKMLMKTDYTKFKKQVLWFAIPLLTIWGGIIYWESLSIIKYFPLTPWLAVVDTALKIVQLLIFCFIIGAILRFESVHLALRGLYLTNRGVIRIFFDTLLIVLFFLYMGIEVHSDWYEKNVYRPKAQAEFHAEVEKHNEKWDAYFEEQETTNSN